MHPSPPHPITASARKAYLSGRAKRKARHPRDTGFSLVEVLVATVIFALGLGGLSLMLLTSTHGSVETQNQTMASMQAASLAELIMLNPAAEGHYISPAPVSGGNCLAPEACSDAAWAAANLMRWRYSLEQSLAGATGLVCRDATPEDGNAAHPACDGNDGPVVKIFWIEPEHVDEQDKGRRRTVLPVPD